MFIHTIMSIDVCTSIHTNSLSWVVILIAVSIVSYPDISAGFITFFGLLLFAYGMHRCSHDSKNIFTILHHYHHDNDNFFSHFSQILLELLLGMLVVPLHYLLGNSFINTWTGLLFTLFYSTVHNINYGLFRVNDVHYLHHKEIYTNIGPDICDIAFHTKNPKNTEVENTWHYIPNVIVISILILFIKHFSENDEMKQGLRYMFAGFSILCILIVSISSFYLNCIYTPTKKDVTEEIPKNKNKELEEDKTPAEKIIL